MSKTYNTNQGVDAINGFRVYTHMSQLGLTTTPTLQQLFDALPAPAFLLFDYSDGGASGDTLYHISDLPKENLGLGSSVWGMGVFIKLSMNRSVFMIFFGTKIIMKYVNTTAANYQWCVFDSTSTYMATMAARLAAIEGKLGITAPKSTVEMQTYPEGGPGVDGPEMEENSMITEKNPSGG